METKNENEGLFNDMRGNSVARRVSLLVKFASSIVVIMVVAWLSSSLREKEDVKEVERSVSSVVDYPKFEKIRDGGKEYALENVEFVFETEQAGIEEVQTTRARLKLVGFSRDGSPIDVGKYRLGTYKGECEQFDGATYMTMSSVDPGALAFAQCVQDGVVRRLAVFQDGKNLVVKTRSMVEEREVSGLTPILVIDITKIVK